MALVRFVCFAASVRPGGVCVAGKDMATGKWVRPLTDAQKHSIDPRRLRLDNGETLGIGDIIEADLGEEFPVGCQKENRIDLGRRWKRVRRIGWREAQQFVDEPKSLWKDGDSSTNGLNDRMLISTAERFLTSLKLIRPDELTVLAMRELNRETVRLRHRAKLTYKGTLYRFGLTDRHWHSAEERILAVNNALVCCSVGEPFGPHVYKIAASIITPERLR